MRAEHDASLSLAIAWRHPRAEGTTGRCIGARSDPPVDARRAKRLAHRVRATARRERLPRVAAASPARRCRAVARWLRRFGFAVRIDPRLREFDFGHWEGQRWDAIPRAEVEAWSVDFAHHAPGGGDTLAGFLGRVRELRAGPPAALLVTHGGVLSALRWLEAQGVEAEPPGAGAWPSAPPFGAALRWRPAGSVATSGRAGRPPQAAAASGTGVAMRGRPGAGVFGR